jgi:hypothetical protein
MRGRWGHDAGHVKGGGLGLGDGARQVPLAPPRESPPLHIKGADVDGGPSACFVSLRLLHGRGACRWFGHGWRVVGLGLRLEHT